MCDIHRIQSGEFGNDNEFNFDKKLTQCLQACIWGSVSSSSDAVQCLPSLLLRLPLSPALCDSSTLIDRLNPGYIPTSVPLIYFFTV